MIAHSSMNNISTTLVIPPTSGNFRGGFAWSFSLLVGKMALGRADSRQCADDGFLKSHQNPYHPIHESPQLIGFVIILPKQTLHA
jgi:hypothetical protein